MGYRDGMERSHTSLPRFYDAFFREPKITTMTPFGVPIGTASTVVLVGNTNRRWAEIVNDSDTDCWLGFGTTAVAAKGSRLIAYGGAYTINKDNLFTGTISAITTADNKNISGEEGT